MKRSQPWEFYQTLLNCGFSIVFSCGRVCLSINSNMQSLLENRTVGEFNIYIHVHGMWSLIKCLFWCVILSCFLNYYKNSLPQNIIYSPSCRSKPGLSFFLETQNEILGRISKLQFSIERKQKLFFSLIYMYFWILPTRKSNNHVNYGDWRYGEKILLKLFIFMIISS